MSKWPSPRRAHVSLVGALALLAVACTAPATPPPAPAKAAAPTVAAAAPAASAPAAAPVAPAPAAPPPEETVRMGVLGSSTDAGLFIAQELGYFRDEGLVIELTNFDSAARMVAPLGAGQLDVGAGAHSAGLFNAAVRDVAIKMVADKGSSPPGFGFQGLMFRKDLAESGRLRTPADLKGMRVAVSARGITAENALAAWLRQAGLTLDDVEVIEMGFPEHASALGNRSLDAAISIEPFLTRILDQDVGVLYQRVDEVLPGYQIAEVFYSDGFARDHRAAAQRLMNAYVRAVRYYNDAFVKGDAAKRQEVVAILAKTTTVKDVPLYDRMVMPGLHPDGRMNKATIVSDQDFWLSTGLQRAPANLDQIVDHTFVDAAVQQLGPYR